jgi:hypothetical protein
MKYLLYTLPVFFFSNIASAASGGITGNDASAGGIGNLVENTLIIINDYLTPLVLGMAFLVFIWGVFKFFVLGGADEEKQKEGKSLMIYAIAGFVIIVSFYGIVQLVQGGLGLDNTDRPLENTNSGVNVR